MKYISGFRLALMVSAACLGFIPDARAQDSAAAGGPLEEIVVVSQRQQYRGDTPLNELPQAVQVLDAELLTDIGITRLDSALELASGITRQNNFGGLWDAFAVRGFAGDENFPSGYLVNGFNAGRGYGGPRDASNIERIEILKGPNSALFGRGEPGGTVNIITKKPQFETAGSVSVSAGSYDTYRIEGDITGPITNKIAFRVNGSAEDAGSFRDTLESEKYTASPSVLLQFSDATVLSYEMEYVHQEVPFDRGIVAVNGNLDALPIDRFLGEPGDGPHEIDVLGHQLQFQHELSDKWAVLVGAGYRDTSFTGFSSQAELAASRQTLDETGQFLSRARLFRDYNTEHSVLRGEVNGEFDTGPITHNIIVGADFDKFDIDILQTRIRPPVYVAGTPITPAYNAIDVFNPVYGSMPVPTVPNQDYVEVQEAWGIYFQDQIDVTERFKLRFGGRYDDYTQDIENQISGTQFGQSYTQFSPQAGAVYELSERISFYAGFGEGYRPNSGFDAAGNAFAPETTTSYEVGAKLTSIIGDLSGTLALFSMKKNNILTADPLNAGLSLAVGEAKSRGVEFDMTGTLPGDIRLFLTYAYTDAEISKDVIDPNFGGTIQAGDPLINIPKHSGNLMLFKDFMFGEHLFTLGGGVSHISKRLGETATDFYLPSYTLAKLHASYEPTDQLTLAFDVNNLFDKRYYASSYSQYWIAPGTPRTFTVRASYSF